MLITKEYIIEGGMNIVPLVLSINEKVMKAFNLVPSYGHRGGDNTYSVQSKEQDIHYDGREEFLRHAKNVTEVYYVDFSEAYRQRKFLFFKGSEIFSIWTNGWNYPLKRQSEPNNPFANDKEDLPKWEVKIEVGAHEKTDLIQPIFDVIEKEIDAFRRKHHILPPQQLTR